MGLGRGGSRRGLVEYKWGGKGVGSFWVLIEERFLYLVANNGGHIF